MALHITLEKGDRIILTGGIVIDVRRTGRQTQLSVEAPQEVKIQTIFKDIKRQAEHEANAK